MHLASVSLFRAIDGSRKLFLFALPVNRVSPAVHDLRETDFWRISPSIDPQGLVFVDPDDAFLTLSRESDCAVLSSAILWTRSIACDSCAGFQSGSALKTRFAAVRFDPVNAALGLPKAVEDPCRT